MKQIIFTTILIFTFCFAAFADQPFDDYGKVSWNEERTHLDNLAYYLSRYKDEIVSLRIYINKKTPKNKVSRRLSKMFSYLTDDKKLKIDKTRISFAVFEEDEESTVYWVAESKVQLNDCEGCSIIKGENFERDIKTYFQKNKE